MAKTKNAPNSWVVQSLIKEKNSSNQILKNNMYVEKYVHTVLEIKTYKDLFNDNIIRSTNVTAFGSTSKYVIIYILSTFIIFGFIEGEIEQYLYTHIL